MSAPAQPRIPTPGDLARRQPGATTDAQAPAADTTSEASPAPVEAAPAAGERPTEPRPMYEPRTLTAEEAIAPGVLADTEYFRSVFRWCLTHSALPPHARLLAHDLLHRANHKNGRLSADNQPDIAQLATATGLTEMQAGVALQILHSRGWIAYRTDIPKGTRRLYDLVIPALALERARGRRYLQQQE
jgi:hypothetical protein